MSMYLMFYASIVYFIYRFEVLNNPTAILRRQHLRYNINWYCLCLFFPFLISLLTSAFIIADTSMILCLICFFPRIKWRLFQCNKDIIKIDIFVCFLQFFLNDLITTVFQNYSRNICSFQLHFTCLFLMTIFLLLSLIHPINNTTEFIQFSKAIYI